jgi:hypothetical protein
MCQTAVRERPDAGCPAGSGGEVAKMTPAAATRLPPKTRAPKTSFVTLGEKFLTFRYHST